MVPSFGSLIVKCDNVLVDDLYTVMPFVLTISILTNVLNRVTSFDLHSRTFLNRAPSSSSTSPSLWTKMAQLQKPPPQKPRQSFGGGRSGGIPVARRGGIRPAGATRSIPVSSPTTVAQRTRPTWSKTKLILTSRWSYSKREIKKISTWNAGDHGNSKISKEHRFIDQ